MKIKMFIPIALVLCLAFSLCACGNGTTDNNSKTTVPATTTAAATTTKAPTTAPATTAATTENNATDEFTEEDALALVRNEYPTEEKCHYYFRGTEEINGETYFAIDLRKTLEVNTTYMGLTYFVKADGSEIIDGYYSGGEVVFNSDEKPSFDVDEETAVKLVNAAYDFEDNCFLTLRGMEEIDGVNYYAVDLRKSFEDHSTYLSTFFVNEDGSKIVKGYYEGDVAHLSE